MSFITENIAVISVNASVSIGDALSTTPKNNAVAKVLITPTAIFN